MKRLIIARLVALSLCLAACATTTPQPADTSRKVERIKIDPAQDPLWGPKIEEWQEKEKAK